MYSSKLAVITAFYLFLGGVASPTVSTTGPTTVQHYGPWNHKGCFVDRNPDRILRSQQDTWGKNTVEYCLDLCHQQEFPLAGVEYGGECYCGKDWNSSNIACPGNCNMTCVANSGEICGGVYAINVYERGSGGSGGGGSGGGGSGGGGSDPWTPCGCYQEPLLGLSILLPLVVELEVLTVTSCQEACLAKGSHGCAVDSGDTCRCAGSVGGLIAGLLGLLKLGSEGCTLKCPGNSGETCGGLGAFQAYTYRV